MYITGKCKKCNERVVFLVENRSKEQIEEIMKTADFGECLKGFHVEIGKMSDYYEVDFNNRFKTSKEASDHNRAIENNLLLI